MEDSLLETDNLSVFEFFLKRQRPTISVELGCSPHTTGLFEKASLIHNVFDSRQSWVAKVEDSYDFDISSFTTYSRVEETLYELDLFKSRYDFALIDGPLPDRVSFTQKLLDLNCDCVILQDYEFYSKIGYKSIRKPHDYDFKVFNHSKSPSKTGVYLLNQMTKIKITDHV